jgi:glycosyl transferase, family 25
MHAYVINLARSRDRRKYITAHLDKIGIGYELVPAVDGRGLNLDDSRIFAPAFRANVYNFVGLAGATLSHRAVYRKIIEDGFDTALVLEDDIILPADIEELADAVGKELVGAEIALISIDIRTPFKVSTQSAVALPSSRFLALPIDVGPVASGGAYVITREACQRMLEHNVPLLWQSDAWAHFYSDGALDRVRCVVPLSAHKNPDFSSTIGSYSLGTGVRGRLMAVIMRHRIPILHQVMARRRRAIYRKRNTLVFTDEPFVNKPSRLDYRA